MLAPVLAQLGEQVHAAHVALAPRGHAIAHPVFFGGDALGQQRLFGFFLRQDLVTPGLELGEAAVKAARCAAVQPDGAVGQRLEKAAIMADEHHGAAQRLQFRFQPFDGGKVEMVGGLVEQQDIGGRRQRARDGGAADLAAREARGILRAAEAQIAQQADAAVWIVGRAETRLHIVHHGGEAREIRLLRQISQRGAGLQPAAALVVVDETGGDLEKRRLARAVAPHQGDPLALGHGKLGAFEHRLAAEGQFDVAEMKQDLGHGCGRISASAAPVPVRRDRIRGRARRCWREVLRWAGVRRSRHDRRRP